MKEQILFVDDDPNILEAYERKLQQALRVCTAQGPHTGLRDIKEKGPFAVVIADMHMPKMNGVEFLKKVKEIAPDTIRMMLTGNADINVAMKAVNEGDIFRFLTKPCPSKLMGDSLIAGINQYRLVVAEKEILDGTLKSTVQLLVEILSWINPDAFGITMQLHSLTLALAEKLKVENTWEIELAASLSQIGHMAIPQSVILKLNNGDELTQEEITLLESTPSIGKDLLKKIPRLANVSEIVYYQSKHFDGGGFPENSTAGECIPIGARILKVARDYHELRSSDKSRKDCLKEMNSREGWYDPAIVSILGRVQPVVTHVQSKEINVVQITLNRLKAGLTLASPILTTTGKKLVGSGMEITEAFLIRLRKYAELEGIVEPINVLIHQEETKEAKDDSDETQSSSS